VDNELERITERGQPTMSEREKFIVEQLKESVSNASEETRLYLLGLADGMALEQRNKSLSKEKKDKD